MRVRFCLTILAMLSLALLPGPAHALAHVHPGSQAHLAGQTHLVGHAHIIGHAHLTRHAHPAGPHRPGVHHHDASSGSMAALGHRHDRSGHHHGATCDTACCAPMCSLYAPPTTVASRIGHPLTPPMPTSDRPRQDAATPRSLRPPEPA